MNMTEDRDRTHITLEVVPGLGDEGLRVAILIHGLVHVLLDQILNLGSQHRHRDGCSELQQQHHDHQPGELGVKGIERGGCVPYVVEREGK